MKQAFRHTVEPCAEGTLKEAERLYDVMMAKYSDSLSMTWISKKIFGRDEEAQRLLEPYDQNMDLDVLMDFASYHYFDPTPFPNLVQYLKSQGIEPRKPLEMTFRCKACDSVGIYQPVTWTSVAQFASLCIAMHSCSTQISRIDTAAIRLAAVQPLKVLEGWNL